MFYDYYIMCLVFVLALEFFWLVFDSETRYRLRMIEDFLPFRWNETVQKPVKAWNP